MLRVTLIIVLIHFFAETQQTPVHWKFYARKNQGDTIEIHMKATISKGWYMYSLNNGAGPGATEVTLFKQSGIKYEGAARQLSKPVQTYDLVFKTNVLAFSRGTEFMQLAYRKDTSVMTIAGMIRYMVCNGRNCLPPRSDSFQVKLN